MPISSASLVCLAIAAAAALPAAPVEAPRPDSGVRLQYRFQTGETIRYRIEHEATYVASAAGQRDKQETLSLTDRRFEVASVADDGTMVLRFSLDRAKMQVRFDDGDPVAFDSASNEDPLPQYAEIKGVIGRELAEVRLRPDGTILELRPLLRDEELEAIPGKLGLGSNGDARNNLFVIFPDRPLQIGDEWNHTESARITVTGKLTQEIKILHQFRLESIAGGVATISVKSAPLTSLTEPSLAVQLIQRTSTGQIRFDLDAGRVIGRSTRFDNMEIGWAGADSTYRAVSRWSEKIADEPKAISAR